MELEELKERVLLGKHLSLVERRHLMFIGNIPGHVVASFSTGYQLADEYQDEPHMQEFVKNYRHWLDYNLTLTVSVKARGRSDLVSVLGMEEDSMPHTDAGNLPPSRRRLSQEARQLKNGAVREVKSGLRLP